MEIKLPKQLQDTRFRFVFLTPKKKYPKEIAWQVNDSFYGQKENETWFEMLSGKVVEVPEKTAVKHNQDIFLIETDSKGKKHYYYKGECHSYGYDDPKLIDWTSKGGCLGLLTGVGGIVVVDLDQAQFKDRLLQATPKTFTGLSGSKKLPHLYYFIDDLFEKYPIKDENKKTIMDILGLGAQVVIPLSEISEDCKYEILHDVPITKISTAELKALLYQFEVKKKPAIEKKVQSSSSDFIDGLISKVSVPNVLSDLGIDTSKNPTNCPFHSSEKGQCLGFTDEVCHCFNCDKSFNVISLVKEGKNLESSEAIDYLSELGGLQKERKADKEQWFKDNVEEIDNQPPIKTIQEIINKAKPLDVWGIKDYKEHKPCKKFLIKGIKKPNESEMLAAPSAAGKSILALNQALSIASGRKWLDKFQTRKSPVLFVVAENSNDWVKEKLEWMMRGMRVRSNRIPLYFLPRNQCEDLMDFSFAARICKIIEEKGIKVVYLDTANPLTPSLDDNSAKDVTGFFNHFLKPVIDKYGVNITFLAHTDKKGNDYLGSMKWFANADCSYRLDRKGLDNRITLFNEKNRSGEIPTLDIELNFDNEKKTIELKLLGEREAQRFTKKKKMTQQEFFILKLKNLVKDKSLERKEIQDIFKENDIKFSIPTLDRALKTWREQE